MEKLRVDVDGIQVMASRWHAHAVKLAAGAPPTSGLSCQASAAAVNTGHADVAVATASLTGRVQTTATKVAEADARYVANEASSAARLDAVGRPG